MSLKAPRDSLLLRRSAPDRPRLLLFAHRGFSALAPENTLAAFRAALDHGIPGVELDVQLTRDRQVVVLHDFNLKRITGRDSRVRECTAAQIRRLDAGAWFSEGFRGQRVPLLEEVFDLLGERAYCDIELKWESRQTGWLEQKVLDLIRSYRLEDRCLVSSFNPFCIRAMQRLDPFLPKAHIYSNHREIPFLLRHGEGRLLCPTAFIKPQASKVRRCSALAHRFLFGAQILAWTVDEPAEALRLARLGVKGLISNHPARVRMALAGAGFEA